MTTDTQTVVQVHFRDSIERLSVSVLKYEDKGVSCVEVGRKEYNIFIPYTSIRMITSPKDTE